MQEDSITLTISDLAKQIELSWAIMDNRMSIMEQHLIDLRRLVVDKIITLHVPNQDGNVIPINIGTKENA